MLRLNHSVLTVSLLFHSLPIHRTITLCSRAEGRLLHVPPSLPILFLCIACFFFFPLPIRVITLLYPCEATFGIMCSILHSSGKTGGCW